MHVDDGGKGRGRDRWKLASILVAAAGIRLWWANPFAATPVWSDPDGYLFNARHLADYGTTWAWSWRAIDYAEFIKAPLYQIMLSIATWLGPDEWAIRPVLAAHALLPCLTIIAVYGLGRTLHSSRAGLVAAAVYAVWVPNILVTPTLWQEHLYVPLVTAGLALLAKAVATRASLRRWALTGAVLGLAALTRSSIAYFLPVAACVYGAVMFRDAGVRRVVAIMVGFAIVTGPYVMYVSSVAGHLVPIENIGAFALRRADGGSQADPPVRLNQFMSNPAAAPRGMEIVRFLVADFRTDPQAFVSNRLEYLRLLLKPGGASMQLNTSAGSLSSAWASKVAAHLTTDLPVVAITVLWPLGVVLSRKPLAAGVVAGWIPWLGLMLIMTLWAGTRFRSPAEPVALALVAIVLAGGWRSAGTIATTAGASLSLVLLVLTAPHIAESARAFPSYGVGPWSVTESTEGRAEGRAGMNIFAARPVLAVELSADVASGPSRVALRLDGREIDQLMLAEGEARQLRYVLPGPGLVYLELVASDPSGRPAVVRFDLRPAP